MDWFEDALDAVDSDGWHGRGYASHLQDQTIRPAAIAMALGTTAKVQNTTILDWLKADPARTLKALTERCIECQREIEGAKPQEAAVTT